MFQVLILTLYGLAALTGLGFVAGMMVWAFDGTVNGAAMGAMALLTAGRNRLDRALEAVKRMAKARRY